MANANVFTIPESGAKLAANQFKFRAAARGKQFTLPKIAYLSGDSLDLMEAAVSGGSGVTEAQLTRQLVAIENPEAGEVVRKLTNDQVLSLSQQWAEASVPPVEDADADTDE